VPTNLTHMHTHREKEIHSSVPWGKWHDTLHTS